jgi:photosystem II stability/assembly factor-like uncharacterized protein
MGIRGRGIMRDQAKHRVIAIAGAMVAAMLFSDFAVAETDSIRHVAARIPVQGISRELAAERAANKAPAHTPRTRGPMNPWRLQQTLPGAIVHDLAFPTASVGYAAAELGQVWKTTDGGDHWDRIMNVGYPYYWYGVYALDADHVAISGFENQNGLGVVRWSDDGGMTWSDDVVLTDRGWSLRVRFADASNGLVMDLVNFDAANAAHYTTDGGALAADWTSLVVDADGGWFGNQFSLLPSGRARASGITYCDSVDTGAVWNCGPPVDATFDGPVFFYDEMAGWVGGGEISPDVAGWVHRTTDGGTTWSDRTLDTPWPVREILFVTPDMGWAAGGNIYSNAGGLYFSNDGGKNWTLDLDSEGRELDACAHVGTRVWCAGYDAAFDGAVYALDLGPSDVIFANGFDPAAGAMR